LREYAPLKREDAKVNKPDLAGGRGCPAAADPGRKLQPLAQEQTTTAGRDEQTRAAVFELMAKACIIYGFEIEEVYRIK
jgi:hypothetical protein